MCRRWRRATTLAGIVKVDSAELRSTATGSLGNTQASRHSGRSESGQSGRWRQHAPDRLPGWRRFAHARLHTEGVRTPSVQISTVAVIPKSSVESAKIAAGDSLSGVGCFVSQETFNSRGELACYGRGVGRHAGRGCGGVLVAPICQYHLGTSER